MSAAKPAPMVVKAARVLNKRCAEACGVNAQDQWLLCSADVIADAQAALDAAGASDLLEALQRALNVLDAAGATDEASAARAAIAKATGDQS